METLKLTKKKRIISLLTVLIIIANMFAPYGVLAASPAAGEPYFLVKLHPISDPDALDPDTDEWNDDDINYYVDSYYDEDISPADNTVHVVTVDIILKGTNTSNAGGFNIAYDPSVLTPGYFNLKKKSYTKVNASDLSDFVTQNWTPAPENSLSEATNQIRLEGSTTSRFADGEVLASMTFILKDGVSYGDIKEDVFTVTPANGLENGVTIAYYPSGSTQENVQGAKYWVPEGFASSNVVKVSAVSVVDQMTKTKYYHDEALNFAGATIKIEYTDGTDETLTLTQAISDGKVTVDSTDANKTTKKVVITAGDETCDLSYNVATGISIGTQPTVNYVHGDTINFSGGDIIVTYDNSSTEVIPMTDSRLTKNRTVADVDNPTVDFTYADTSITKATLNLTVEDPLDHIEVDTNPTTTTYNHGQTISGTGGTIKAVTKSGKVTSGISMTDASVTLSPTLADINACTSTWPNGALTAGNQTINISYTDAKGVTKGTSMQVVVNDTITGIAVKSDVTAKNKYNTAAASLNYSGAAITVSTGSGNTFDVNVNSGMVDTTGYVQTSLTQQNLPVTYGGFTTPANAGINLTLSNYINGITVSTANPVRIVYGNALDLTGVTYTKNYADGTSSSPVAVTSGMVSGYTVSPSASKFNASHEAAQTVTVTLSTPDDAAVDVVPQTGTFTATTLDKVTGISLSTYPTKVTYNYGDAFDRSGGKIKLAYASGASGSEISMSNSSVSITEADGTPVNMSPAGTDFGSTHRVNKNLSVSYNDGTDTFTGVTIPILIKDTLSKAEITTAPTTTFEHGDAFSVGPGKITLTFVSGNTDVRDLDDGTAIIDTATNSAVNMSPSKSAYNSDHEVTKHLRVSFTENGVTRYDEYDITITDAITSITVTTPPGTTYNIGDTAYTGLDTAEITITRGTGPDGTVKMNDANVSLTPLNTLTTTAGSNIPVTVSYGGKTTTFDITVSNGVAGITITPPTDVTFEHADALTFGGGSIVVTYADTTTQTKSITADMVKETISGTVVNMSPNATDYDATTHTLTKNLTISYEEGGVAKTATYDITIKNSVDTIAISTTNPPKDSYNLNESPTYPDGQIEVSRKAGDTSSVDITSTMVSGLDTSSAGTGKTATVTYETKNATYNYNVVDNVTKIEVTAPTKTAYNHGDTLDLTGGLITVTYASGTTSNPEMKVSMITDGTSAVNMSPDATDYTNYVLNKTLTIKYEENGKEGTASYPITITNNITGIAMGTDPTDTNYQINDTTYKLAGGDINVIRAVGPAQNVSLTDPGVTLTDITTLTGSAGKKTVTVSYGGESTTFEITVTNAVDTITVTPPTDDTFEHNGTLTFNGGSILVSYLDGTSQTKAITADMVKETSTGTAVNMSPNASDYNASTHTLTKNLTITYTEDGKTGTATYDITISNPIDSITISTTNPPKDSYNLNETPTYPDGAIIPVRKAGDSDAAISITADMVTNLDTTAAGTGKTATVSYSGKTVNYTYDVIDNVSKIEIIAPTKTTYNYGDSLDLTGGVITVTYAGGSTSNPEMKVSMITEQDNSAVDMSPVYADFTNNQLSKTLTIKYEENGKVGTASYPITIVNNVTGIEMGTDPTDTIYDLNATTYKLEGGDIVVTRAVGPSGTVALTDPGISLSDISTITNTSGTKPVTVTYEGQTTSFNITVQDAITSISIAGTPKTTYEIDEAIDPTLSIVVHRPSGDTTIPVTSAMISGFSTATEGTNLVATITYEGQTVDYTYNVTDAAMSIAMKTTPKTNYLVGETLDVTGGVIEITKKSGATETVSITPDMVTGFDSSSVVTGQTLTVTYNGLTTTYQINVTNPVSSITLNPGPTKTAYKYGEALELSGAYIDVVFENGTTDRMAVTSSMVSGYDANTLGDQTVTVAYGKNSAGNDVTATFTVNVADYTSGINVVGAKTDYNYGEALDLNLGTVEVTLASGAPIQVKALDDPDVTVEGYSATTIGNQTLTVRFDGKTTTYVVNVKDYVTGTSIVVPTKTTYNYGESLNLSTGRIVQTWASGKPNTEISLDSTMVTEEDGTPVDMTPSSFNSTNKVQKTLKITSDGVTENYPITIINDVRGITIKQTPKTNYNYGDAIDSSVGSVEITRGNGTKEEIMLSDPRLVIEGFDTSAEGTVPVTVKFTENGITKQTSYAINVTDTVTSITLVGTPKTNYKYGEGLDVTGLTLTVVRPSGTGSVPVTAAMAEGYNPNELGSQTVNITYGGQTVSYTVNVEDYLRDIELVKPTKVKYKLGETLDLTGASITEVMASGARVTGISVTPDMVSALDTSVGGTKTLTVTYTKNGETFTKQFAVTVQDGLSGIEVKSFPVDEYLYGEALDLTGATIEVELESGAKEIIPITKSMVSGYTSKPSSSHFEDSKEYIQTITITYTKDDKTITTTYPITTMDYPDEIVVENMKKNYKYGENLNLVNTTVAVKMASGVIKDRDQLTYDMISGYNPNVEGNQPLTIKYQGKQTTEIVNVSDDVLAISMYKNPNKVTYNIGEGINLAGAKLNVIKRSGSYVIDITNSMISGYNPNVEGVQEITVTYDGFTTEFAVNVLPIQESTDTPEETVDPTPSRPSSRPSSRPNSTYTPSTSVTTVQEQPVEEQPITETPVVEKPVEKTTSTPKTTTKPVEVEKPTETLGVKEDLEESGMMNVIKIIAGITAVLGLLILLFLLFFKRNVKVYVEEDGEFVLGGIDKITKNNPKLDIDQYLDEDTYPNRVKVHLDDSISEKLDGIEIEIKHRGQTIKHKVHYEDEPYEFILDAISESKEISK